MTEPRPLKTLLELYELLWEQIKDEPKIMLLTEETQELRKNRIITKDEERYLDYNIIKSKPKSLRTSAARKAFVQRMIKELTIKE